ncbi:MAG: hypothetical protein AAF657_35300, partial [Acidobacteriota bacterium]
TRARRRVMVVGSIDLVRAATRRGSRRASGLVDALRPAESRPEPEDETPPPSDEASEGEDPQQLSLFG